MSRHERDLAQTDKIDVTPDLETQKTTETKPPKRLVKQVVLALVAVGALAGMVDFGHTYWTSGRFMIETDDAYVTADTTLISSRVQGYVSEVSVKQNDIVKAGDVLVRLDDGDYLLALELAKERVLTADQTIGRFGAQITAAEAGVAQAEAMKSVAEAQVRAAKSKWDRSQQLATRKVASQAQLDSSTEALETTTASLANANAAILNAKAQIGVLHAQQAEANGAKHELELAVKQAQRNLDLTVLRSPADGTLANLTLEVGDLVSPGVLLAALVPMNDLYVEANFKETQIYEIALGATVHISFDAIPDQVFEGNVSSVSPATGSVFSLLPADNATGNFTKIVQRVPVRIDIPDAVMQTGHLRAGLSAIVEVDSRTGSHAAAIAQAE
ncbi:HlyD family secretion protein [Falsihalocynthiibacter arcticus]|uniref:Hemolysin D n=1 Tax=Falsihalocynthiibacter arcticus TaxID=1579316 RepID=A0A126V1C5_9RHOB|nr:HlyD family secretion protein [Falsihalocynthiibacter arcticus]AML52132.1 hemolysin D [Falsihalocynthiibacter arcticus]